MMPDRITTTRVQRVPGGDVDDRVAVEEPLEIRVGDKPVSVTLRTPGDDFELAAGFLFTESILHAREDVAAIRHWGSPNVVRVDVGDHVRLDLGRLQRHFYSTSSCGVCGKTSIDAVRVSTTPLDDDVRVSAETVVELPSRLRAAQPTFDATGAIHAAAACTASGEVVVVREDVGRHNAVDKIAGRLILDGARADVLVVSGRTSFEVVQKCAVARIPLLAGVGAPTSLAIDLARELNVTLLGFVRDGRFNVYSGAQRIG